MRIAYYPGCSLKTSARVFERSALSVSSDLGMELVELPRWNCCGTVYSLASDDLMHHIAPLRNLIRTQEMFDEGLIDENSIVTFCSMCYNTLKRAQSLINTSAEKRATLNDFMEEEVGYRGETQVKHLLELIDPVRLAEIATSPLNLRIAPYYGCMLVRPEDAAIDDVERPRIIHDVLASVGVETVDFPLSVECCGSYLTVNRPDVVADRTYRIIRSAMSAGAEALVTSCPLCTYNLDFRQKTAMERHPDHEEMPVLYFTEVLELATGGRLTREDHFVDPSGLIEVAGDDE